jgi:hypothetical protein
MTFVPFGSPVEVNEQPRVARQGGGGRGSEAGFGMGPLKSPSIAPKLVALLWSSAAGHATGATPVS